MKPDYKNWMPKDGSGRHACNDGAFRLSATRRKKSEGASVPSEQAAALSCA